MSRAWKVRGWLLKHPRPAAIRVQLADDELQTLEVAGSFAALGTSIDALDPIRLEALDKSGKLVRAIKLEQLEGDASETDDDEASTPEAKREARRLEREQAMLITFANLLAEAYKHSTTVAFSKMVELFEAVSRRGESMEKSLQATERLLRKTYEQAAGEAVDGEPSLLESVISAFAAGKANGGVEQAVASAVANAPRKTNGKGTQI